MALLHGRTGRLTIQNGGFRPRQYLFWQDEALEPTGVLSGSARRGGEARNPDDDDDDDDDEATEDDGGAGATLPPLNPGYRRLRGYPREGAKGCEDTLLVVEFGLGRMVASQHCSSASYQIHYDNQCLFSETTMRPDPRCGARSRSTPSTSS